MHTIEYNLLSQEQFEAHAQAIYAEQERRSKLASIPTEVQKLSNDFQSLGGDKEELITKINEVQDDTETSL